jgi:hypothetical protein
LARNEENPQLREVARDGRVPGWGLVDRSPSVLVLVLVRPRCSRRLAWGLALSAPLPAKGRRKAEMRYPWFLDELLFLVRPYGCNLTTFSPGGYCRTEVDDVLSGCGYSGRNRSGKAGMNTVLRLSRARSFLMLSLPQARGTEPSLKLEGHPLPA